MAFLTITSETRRSLNESDRRWEIKLGMRAVTTFFAFIAMILFATATDLTKRNYGGNDWVDSLPLAPVLLALLYNPTIIFLTIVHRNGRPIHPGWDVAVDLLIWALAVPGIVLSTGDGWFLYWEPVTFEFGDLIPCVGPNDYSYQCNPLIYTLGKMEIAANVFLGLILIIHFILFVLACIATHKWRKTNQRAAAAARNVELQYHRSPEEHMAHQPHPPPAYTPSAEGTAPTSRSGEENPFKDPPHMAAPSQNDDPFRDPEHAAVKYA